MPTRPHPLASALLAAALAGCCVRQPSSVDAVPGGWISLADLPGLPGRARLDGGDPPAKVPSPASTPVAGETPPPLPVAPVARIPDVPDKGPIPGSIRTVPDPRGVPPEPAAVVGDEPGRARPLQGPQPVGLPGLGQPTSPPAADGRAVIPSLAELGQRPASGGSGIDLPDAEVRPNTLSKPSALPGLAGLPPPESPPRPSLGGSSDIGRVTTPARIPSIGVPPGRDDAAAARVSLPRVSAGEPESAEGLGPFSLGILPGLSPREASGAGEVRLVGPSIEGEASRPGSRLTPIAPAPLTPLPRASDPESLLAGSEALGETSGPSVFGELFRYPRPVRVSGNRTPSPGAAPARPDLPVADLGAPSAPGSSSAALSRLPAVASTGAPSPQPAKLAASAGGKDGTAPVPAGPGSVSRVPLPAPSGLDAPAGPADPVRTPAAPSAAASSSPVASRTEASPRAPAASDVGSAQRRLEELREEYAAYEREAARLRAILRRALGLDGPEDPPAAPESGEGVRLNGDAR